MRINLLSNVKPGFMARLVPALLILALTPAVKAATAPIVFSGLESSPFGGTFQSATSVATDAAGNLYVSEPTQNRVSKVAPDGTRTVLTFTVAVNAPRGLVVDLSNNLWIANSGANNLIRHPLGGGADSTIGGFSRPFNIAIDIAGNLYVSNIGNNTVSKVAGGVVTPLVTSGIGGVRGLAVDTTDNLYIAVLPADNVVVVSATTGVVKGTIVASSTCQPRDVALNSAGDLFIACNNTTIIYRIPNEAGILTVADKSVVASSKIPAADGVHGLAFDAGTLYATSGQTIVDKIQLDSVDLSAFLIGSPNATKVATATLNFSAITTSTLGQLAAYSEGIVESDPVGPADYRVNGTGTTCPVGGGNFGAGTTCTVTIDFYPNAVGVRHGGVVFSDTSNPKQPIFTLPIAGTGLGSRVAYGPGLINFFNPTIAGTGFSGPVAMQVDGIGNRFVADLLNNRVVEFDQQLTTGTVVGTGLTFPNGVAVDGSGNVYIADSALGIVLVPNENGTLNTAHQSVVTADVSLPAGIRFDKAQSLYVADAFNDRIVKIPYEDGKLNGLHEEVIGSGFVQPNGVFPDPSGNVWVADTGNNRIVKIAPDGTQTTVAIDTNQISGQLDSPGDVVLDAAGDLYISDTNNYRVIYVSADLTVQAVVPGAQTPSQPGFGAFGGLWIDPVGWLYIPDFLANRIEQVQNFPFPLAFPNTAMGSTSLPQVIEASNIGNAPLNFKSLTFPNDFKQQAVGSAPILDCSATTILTGGRSCFIGVVFKPTTTGVLSENLNVVNTDLNAATPAFNTDVFPLSGTAQGVLSVNPLALIFPVTPDGTTSPAQSITVKNLTKNSTSLTLTFIGTNSSDFAISSKTCGATLAGGASCTVSLVFKPILPANGSRSAQLQVASGVPGGSVLVDLSGSATIPALVATPNALVFPATQEFTQNSLNFTLSNFTNVPVYLRFTTTLNPVAYTVFPSPSCNGLIAANASCVVGVLFRPTTFDPVNPGNDVLKDILTIAGSTDAVHFTFSTTVSLSGTVTAPPGALATGLGKLLPGARVTLNPSTVSFGQKALFTTSASTLTVANHTGLTSYLSLTVPAGYAANSACPAVLRSGTTCTIKLSFRPETAGAHDGYLTTTLIPANGSASHSAQMNVTGSGK